MVCMDVGLRKLYMAEDRRDFSGWNILGYMDVEDRPEIKMVLAGRNVIGKQDIRPVFVTNALIEEMLEFNFQHIGLNKIVI